MCMCIRNVQILWRKRFKSLHKLREKFVRGFDSERIHTPTIDDYIFCKNSKQSFCCIIEQELSDLDNAK